MEREKIAQEIGAYQFGAVFNISWDRRNGDLSDDYVLLGFENNVPILKRYEEGKNLAAYSEVPTFDIFNPEILVSNLTVDAHKSAEMLEIRV